MKKCFCVLLVVMLVASLCGFAQADSDTLRTGDYEYEVLPNGTVRIIKYRGNAEKLTIPDTLNKKKVTSLGDDIFGILSKLTSVTIPESIREMGGNPFASCDNLKQITVSSKNPYFYVKNGVLFEKATKTLICYPKALTAKKYEIPQGTVVIGRNAFNYCKNLTSVSIPDSVTKIGDYSFFGCIKIPSITIPSSVISIGAKAFSTCVALRSITIPSSVTSIGDQAFNLCTDLTSVTIPSSVKHMGKNPFCNCQALKQIDVSSKNSYFGTKNGILYENSTSKLVCYPAGSNAKSFSIPQGITSIGSYAFAYCRNLTDVTIPDSVTCIEDSAFAGCGLISVTIPGSVTSIEKLAFDLCESLTSITISNGVISLGNGAFSSCNKLTSITIPESVKEMVGNPFRRCNILYRIEVSWKNPYFEAIGGVLYEKSTNRLVCYPEGLGDKVFSIPQGITAIGDSAFENCYNLTKVTIPNSVKSIGERAFWQCRFLTRVTIPDSISSIGKLAFDSCPSLTVTVARGSYAERYCKDNNVSYVYSRR